MNGSAAVTIFFPREDDFSSVHMTFFLSLEDTIRRFSVAANELHLEIDCCFCCSLGHPSATFFSCDVSLQLCFQAYVRASNHMTSKLGCMRSWIWVGIARAPCRWLILSGELARHITIKAWDGRLGALLYIQVNPLSVY